MYFHYLIHEANLLQLSLVRVVYTLALILSWLLYKKSHFKFQITKPKMALFLNMRKISEVSVQLLVYGLLHMK